MSWTLDIPATAKKDFNDAVDAAEVERDDPNVDAVDDAIKAAKTAMKSLARQVKGAFIGGVASGHSPVSEEDGGVGHQSDTVSASVFGATQGISKP